MVDGEVWAAWTHLSGYWVLEQTFLLGFRVLDRGLFLPTFATAWNPTSAGSSAYRSPSNKQGGAAGEPESLELFWGRAWLGRVSKLDLSAVVSIVVGRKGSPTPGHPEEPMSNKTSWSLLALPEFTVWD